MEIAEETLLEFKAFLELNTKEEQDVQDLMSKFCSLFKMETLLCKFLIGASEINKTTLLEIKELLITAFKSRNHIFILKGTFECLAAFFAVRELSKISRIFYVLTLDAIEDFGKSAIPDPDNCAEEILITSEIKCLTKQFSLSAIWYMSSKKGTHPVEKSFDDLLKKLNISDNLQKTPVVIKTGKQAKQLFDLIQSKLVEFEQNFTGSAAYLETKKLEILHWRGLLSHEIIKFDLNKERILERALESIKFWNELLDLLYQRVGSTGYGKDSKVDDMFINIAERYIFNYDKILQIESEKILNKDTITHEEIGNINLIRGHFIAATIKMKNFIDIKPDKFTGQIVAQLYYAIAEQLRSIITSNKNDHKQYLESSLIYIRSCCSARDFISNDQKLDAIKAQMIRIKILDTIENEDQKIEMAKKLQAQADKVEEDSLIAICNKIDSSPFICRFRKTFNE